jgi:hypothetical protein
LKKIGSCFVLSWLNDPILLISIMFRRHFRVLE